MGRPRINPTFSYCIDCKEEKKDTRRPRCHSCANRELMLGKQNALGTSYVMSDNGKRNISIGLGGTGARQKYPGLPRWTRLVKERDGHKCAECGYQGTDGKKDVDAHHVIPKASHPELATVLFNGVTLCKPCHKELHKCKV